MLFWKEWKTYNNNNCKVKTNIKRHFKKPTKYMLVYRWSMVYLVGLLWMFMIILFECNKVVRVALRVIKDDEHFWLTNVIDNRIIQNVRLLSLFCRWHPHSLLSNRIIPGKDFTEVYSFVSFAIGMGISVLYRVVGTHSKIHPFSIFCSCKYRK